MDWWILLPLSTSRTEVIAMNHTRQNWQFLLRQKRVWEEHL